LILGFVSGSYYVSVCLYKLLNKAVPWKPQNIIIQRAFFKFTEPPNITIPTALNVSSNEGSPVNITCEAKGNPDPLVKWIHNGQVKSFGFKAAYLAFSQINKADSGIYICRANNSVGRTERQLYLKVNGKFEYVLFSRLSAAYYL